MLCPDRDLLRLLPKVLRARDFRLYLEGGKRLTDLWRSGGRAVLGHKPPHVLQELKNAAERGLFAPLPHPMERRFLKALVNFFPGRAFRLYADECSLYRALEEAGFAATDTFPDPAFPLNGEADICLWRPFLDQDYQKPSSIMIPVLPWPLGPVVLVLGREIENAFPAGELVPAVLLAPAARALYDLAAAQKAFLPDGPRYPILGKALGGLKSGRPKSGGPGPKGSPWRRQGIYLTLEPGTNMEEYAALFRRFLEGGFLIPPSPREPIILPLSMSHGEESKLAGLLGKQDAEHP